jgi:alpha-tubulin suppressor-like RCC1 family protein
MHHRKSCHYPVLLLLTATSQEECVGAGDNRVGQLGVLPRGAVFHPSPIKGAVRWASVALSAKHSIAIASDGKVYCWGLNDEGQLGRGTINQECSDPEPVWYPSCAAGLFGIV